jgi:hypothetical protein
MGKLPGISLERKKNSRSVKPLAWRDFSLNMQSEINAYSIWGIKLHNSKAKNVLNDLIHGKFPEIIFKEVSNYVRIYTSETSNVA